MYNRKKNFDLLREESPVLNVLVSDLSNLDQQIFDVYTKISNSIRDNEYAKIIDTIPGIGKYGALSIPAEIGNVDRFPREDNIFSYAGLVPRIYQSSSRKKSHIKKGSSFLKYILVECVQSHIRTCPYSEITEAYQKYPFFLAQTKQRLKQQDICCL